MQPEPIATTRLGQNKILIRFDPAENALRYVLFVTLGFILFFFPFLVQAGKEGLYIYAGIVAVFICIYFLERLRPNAFLHQVAALPMTCGGLALFLGLYLSLQSTGQMTTMFQTLMVLSMGGTILVNAIIIRRLTPEDCVTAAVNMGMLSLSKRGVNVTPPWTSGRFVTFIQWEYYLITSIRILMIASWVYGAWLQGPYMYSTVGIQGRWPAAFALMGFPMSFFFTRFWQIPFILYCQKNPKPLLQKVREIEARAASETRRTAAQEAESSRKQRRAEKKNAHRHKT